MKHAMVSHNGGHKYGSVNQHASAPTNNASSKVTIPMTGHKQHTHQ
jgi:hypothetical protein